MTIENTRKEGLSRSATLFFLLCFLFIVYLMYLVFRPFLSIMIWACVLTVVFRPLFGFLLRLCKNHRRLAAFVTCFLIFVLFIVPITFLAIMIGEQSIELYHAIQSDTVSVNNTLAKINEIQKYPFVHWFVQQTGKLAGEQSLNLEALMQQGLNAISHFAVEVAPSLLMGVGDVVYRFLMIFITMYILFCDGSKVLDTLRASNPLPATYESEFIKNFEDVSFATFYGSLLGSILLGAGFALLYWIMGIESPLFWGTVIAFISLVPVVGALLIWLPMPAFLLLTGSPIKAIVLFIIGGAFVFLIDNIVKPMIIGSRSDMHPLLVFFAVLGGLEVFGFLGLLLGPLVITIFLTFLSLFRRDYQIGDSSPEMTS